MSKEKMMRRYDDVFADDDPDRMGGHRCRLGFEFFIYRKADADAAGCDWAAKVRCRLARWESGIEGLRWINALVAEGWAMYYKPEQYLTTAGVVQEALKDGPPYGGPDGPIVGEDYYRPAGWRGKAKIDYEALNALRKDEVLLVQGFDQS